MSEVLRLARVAAITCVYLLAGAASAHACTNTWTGLAGTTDWHTGGNWTAMAEPGFADDVCLGNGATVTLDTTNASPNSVSVSAGASLTITGVGLETSGGTALNPNVIAGSVTIDGAGAGADWDYNDGHMNIASTATLDIHGAGSTFTNTSASVTTVDGGMQAKSTGGGGTWRNSGAITFHASSGAAVPQTLTMNPTFDTFNGTSTVAIDDVDLRLTQTATEQGPWQLRHNGTIHITGGTHNWSAVLGAAITATSTAAGFEIDAGSAQTDGTFNVPYTIVNGGTLSFNAAGASTGTLLQQTGTVNGTGTLSAGEYDWTDGGLAIPTTVLTKWTLPGSGNRALQAGNTLSTNSLTPTNFSGGTLTMDGDVTLDVNQTLNIAGDLDIAGTGNLTNRGGIVKTAGTGTSTILMTLVDSPGTLGVLTGTLALSNAPPQLATTTLTAGTYNLVGRLQVPGAAVTTNDSDLVVDGAGLHLVDGGGADALADLSTKNGSITVKNGGQLTLAAFFNNLGSVTLQSGATISVVNDYDQNSSGAITDLQGPTTSITSTGFGNFAGTFKGTGSLSGGDFGNEDTVAPGNSPGMLTITGNYTQSSTGTLIEEIGGPASFDRLVVGGLATLGGTLTIQNFGGFTPSVGQFYDAILAAGGRSGTFAKVNQPSGGLFYDVSYGSGNPALRLSPNGAFIGDATVAEGGGSATFTISLARAAPAAASVDWATQDGTATAGSDYTASSGTANFAPGQTTQTVTVPVTNDTAIEPDETFSVRLSNPVGTRISRAAGTGTITNDDAQAAGPTGPAVQPGDIDGFAVAPLPVRAKKVNVAPVSGRVLVRLPGKKTFVPLPDEEQVPVATIVDARHGVVRLFSLDKNGKVQSAIFFEGVFQVLQSANGMTTAKLVLGNFKVCPAGLRSAAVQAAKRKTSASKSVRHLWAEGKGQFRTQGRFATATIRGTKWLTDDRCNGTLVRVAKGAVTVRDFTLKKSVSLKAPKKYLAPAKRAKKRG